MAKWEENEALQTAETLGNVHIAPNVIETIAISTIQKFQALTAVGWYQSTLSGFLGHDKGVMLHNDDGQLVLDVIVDAYYQPNIPETVTALQERIYNDVLETTDIALDEIRVYVSDLVVAEPAEGDA